MNIFYRCGGIKVDANLRNLQLKELSILDEVVRICEKYNLTYYLMYGSLIGAVRHGGFIPWDDDLDIAMPVKDYYEFCKIAQEELPNNLFLQTKDTENNYPDPIARVRDTETHYATDFAERFKYKHYGVWVDIYPLRGMDWPSFTGLFQLFSKVVATRLVYHRAYKDLNGLSVKNKIVHYLTCILPLNKWIRFRDWLSELNKNPSPRYYTVILNPYNFPRMHWKREIFGTPKKVLFEGKYFNAPSDPDAVLKITYGDYMTLPPEDKRVNHAPKDWSKKTDK